MQGVGFWVGGGSRSQRASGLIWHEVLEGKVLGLVGVCAGGISSSRFSSLGYRCRVQGLEFKVESCWEETINGATGGGTRSGCSP